MDPRPSSPQMCSNCGAILQPDHRFCPNCGNFVARGETGPDPAPASAAHDENAGVIGEPAEIDPSILETRKQEPPHFEAVTQQPEDPPTPAFDPVGHPTWGTPETTVQPESGNRTLWLILGIIAFIVIVCCCLLPLGLAAISSFDTAFQDGLRSAGNILSL